MVGGAGTGMAVSVGSGTPMASQGEHHAYRHSRRGRADDSDRSRFGQNERSLQGGNRPCFFYIAFQFGLPEQPVFGLIHTLSQQTTCAARRLSLALGGDDQKNGIALALLVHRMRRLKTHVHKPLVFNDTL